MKKKEINPVIIFFMVIGIVAIVFTFINKISDVEKTSFHNICGIACTKVEINKELKTGMRYIAMDVRVFDGPSFLKHEQSFAGFMLRKDLDSGEIFEPTTVRGKFDITLDGSTVMPCFFDMKTREMIWLDSVLPGCGEYSYSRQANNLNNNIASSTDMLRAYLKMKDTKVTMKELVCLHIDAVGATQVFDKEDADYVVGLGEGNLDVYDFVEINADWI